MTRSKIVYSLAGPEDARDICDALRDNPMDGAYAIAMLRDPDPFALGCNIAARHVFVIARDADGRTIGVCERIVREAFVDGAPCLLPYLGALRVNRAWRGRIGVLRGGFAKLRESAEQPDEAPFALTAIAAGNEVAERILTAGLPGMPIYRRIGAYSTFALRPTRARPSAEIAPATRDALPELATFLNMQNARVQFAPVWSAARLGALADFGLPPEHILLRREAGAIVGAVAVWDQRRLRQTRILKYPPLLHRLRPLAAFAAPLVGLPTPPRVGGILEQATLSLLAAQDDDAGGFLSLLGAALEEARRRRLSVATLGLAAEHPWRATLLEGRRALEYRSTLYAVHWPEAQARVANLPPRMAAPELAFL